MFGICVYIQWTHLRVVAISADILCFNKCEPSDLLLFHRICERNIGCVLVFFSFSLFVCWCTVTMPETKANNRHFFQIWLHTVSIAYLRIVFAMVLFSFFCHFSGVDDALHLILLEKCCSICFCSAYTLKGN